VENFVDYVGDVANFGQNRRGPHQSALAHYFANHLFSISSELEREFGGIFCGQPAHITQKLKFPQFDVSA
jgi:hypothetical protein